jgi:outer membrane protein assembly factor BamB
MTLVVKPMARGIMRRCYRPLRAAIPGTLLAFLSACALFGGDKDEALAPAELVDFEETLDIRQVWSAKLGGGSEELRVALSPAFDGNRVYAASYDGNVSALDPASGKRIWRTELDMLLSAGPGVGGNKVVVAGQDGELIALNAADGSIAWQRAIGGEALARPVVSDAHAVVYTNDGRLRVFSSFDGTDRWELTQRLPPLTLRGAADPLIVGSAVVAGFDNGRLLASSLDEGVLLWEAIISPPAGRSDLDRLADVDGALAAVGQDVYAAGYHGRVAALAAESGQVLWARELSSHAGVAADWDHVYVVGDEGEVIALLRRNGSDVWRNNVLLRRDLTAPTAYHTTVVVGDFEGYLHFFSNIDGKLVARERAGKGRISGAPLVVGNRLLVQNESGSLAAFAVPEPRRRRGAPEIAEDADAEVSEATH